MSCACPVGRACSSPSAAASVERCRVRGRDDLGDRHHPVLPLVVATAGASGWNQHPPWSGRGGHRAVQALGQGQAAGRDLAGPCGGCCRAGSPCSRSLGRRAYPPRRGGASRVGVLFPSSAISFALESAHQLERTFPRLSEAASWQVTRRFRPPGRLPGNTCVGSRGRIPPLLGEAQGEASFADARSMAPSQPSTYARER